MTGSVTKATRDTEPALTPPLMVRGELANAAPHSGGPILLAPGKRTLCHRFAPFGPIALSNRLPC
jgi:hypothetical protein